MCQDSSGLGGRRGRRGRAFATDLGGDVGSGLGRRHAESQHATVANPLDASRLAAAMKLLQSDIEMTGSRFSPVRHADLVAEMYSILGRSGESDYADRMIAFRHTLMNRIHDDQGAAAA